MPKMNEEERRNGTVEDQFICDEEEHGEPVDPELGEDKQGYVDENGEEAEEEEVKREEDEEEDSGGKVEDKDEDNDDEEGDFKGRSSPCGSEEKSRYMFVDIAEIRNDVQCPICLGIIKKTRTVMDCLHRFCRECIDKSMRLGNNECPACRKHCASRRSLRDDPRFDSLIAVLFPNINKYEQEELAFLEEEKVRNKQIQESIAEISQRQSEALVKRRSLGKEASVLPRSQRNTGSRKKRNIRRAVQMLEALENDDDDDSDRGKDSSSADERSTDVRERKRMRRSGGRLSQPSSSGATNHCIDMVGFDEDDLDVYRQSRGTSSGLVWNPELLAWGRGGARSHTRYGNAPTGISKNARNARLNKLVKYLGSLGENEAQLVQLRLVSLDVQNIPSLQQSYLCCQPKFLVKQVREYIAVKTKLQATDIELLMAKEQEIAIEKQSVKVSLIGKRSLEDDETLATLLADFCSIHNHLILAYRKRQNE